MTEHNVYAGFEPVELWQHFAELNRIHRPSGGEKAAADYVRQVAERAECEVLDTAVGNIVVKKKATPGRENASKVAVQAHLDMVCVPESHDFKTNPVKPRLENGRIYASGSSLGADNGIGAAAALALTTTQEPHGPLELIFTVHEEDTMDGAKSLTPQEVQAKLLINLDDETPGCLTVGCAGGEKTLLRLPVSLERADPAWSGWEIAFSRLRGGHSGDEIDQPRANAVKLLTRVLRLRSSRLRP